MKFTHHFPYETPREEQIKAIKFGLKTFLEDDKKFCIVEAGTGVGKSAVGAVSYTHLTLPTICSV